MPDTLRDWEPLAWAAQVLAVRLGLWPLELSLVTLQLSESSHIWVCGPRPPTLGLGSLKAGSLATNSQVRLRSQGSTHQVLGATRWAFLGREEPASKSMPSPWGPPWFPYSSLRWPQGVHDEAPPCCPWEA